MKMSMNITKSLALLSVNIFFLTSATQLNPQYVKDVGKPLEDALAKLRRIQDNLKRDPLCEEAEWELRQAERAAYCEQADSFDLSRDGSDLFKIGLPECERDFLKDHTDWKHHTVKVADKGHIIEFTRACLKGCQNAYIKQYEDLRYIEWQYPSQKLDRDGNPIGPAPTRIVRRFLDFDIEKGKEHCVFFFRHNEDEWFHMPQNLPDDSSKISDDWIEHENTFRRAGEGRYYYVHKNTGERVSYSPIYKEWYKKIFENNLTKPGQSDQKQSKIDKVLSNIQTLSHCEKQITEIKEKDPAAQAAAVMTLKH